jgi:hypothetical protein
MPVETTAQSRFRVAGRIKSRLVDTLRDDLPEMAKTGAFAPNWMTPREVWRQLDQSGYWLSHAEPLAAFLSAEQCVTMIAASLNDLTANDARSWWRSDSHYRPHQVDWNARAGETADRLRTARPNETRTAIYRGPEEESVIFANENFPQDPEVRRQVAILRDALRAAAIHELGFATSSDNGAWVMLVYPMSEQVLEAVLFTLWQKATVASR